MTEEVNFRRPSSFVCCSNSYGTNRVLREMFSYKKGIILLVSYLARVSKWKDVYQRSGSDHIIIVTELDSEGMALARASPDWEKIK